MATAVARSAVEQPVSSRLYRCADCSRLRPAAGFSRSAIVGCRVVRPCRDCLRRQKAAERSRDRLERVGTGLSHADCERVASFCLSAIDNLLPRVLADARSPEERLALYELLLRALQAARESDARVSAIEAQTAAVRALAE